MLNRYINLPKNKSFFLFGARQTGKSTLISGTLPKDSWTIDMLKHDVSLRYAKDPSQFRREAEAKISAGVNTIFIDEVQKVPALLDEVHFLIDKYKIKFILTGSSARKLRRGGADLLAGRSLTRRLHPLTMEEQAEHFDLQRALRFGGLPAVVTGSDDDAVDLLRAYTETYLREEIQAESIVRNLGGFARFLDVAAEQSGQILNFSAVGRDAGLATRTVQEYFQILEDTLIGFRLEAWRKSPRARLVAHPRFYLFDTGVTNALCRRLTANPSSQENGRLFEQWVVTECKNRLDYLNEEARLFFWRTNVGAEVDLLIEKHGEIKLAAEIKAKTRIVGADITGLKSFMEAHPKTPGVVICLTPEKFQLDKIEVLPYREFFDRLEETL